MNAKQLANISRSDTGASNADYSSMNMRNK